MRSRRKHLRNNRSMGKNWLTLVPNIQVWASKTLNPLWFRNVPSRVQVWRAPKGLLKEISMANRVLELSTHLSTQLRYPAKHKRRGMMSPSWRIMDRALNRPNFRQSTAFLRTEMRLVSHRSRRTTSYNKATASTKFHLLAQVVSKCKSRWWTKLFSSSDWTIRINWITCAPNMIRNLRRSEKNTRVHRMLQNPIRKYSSKWTNSNLIRLSISSTRPLTRKSN